MDPVVQQLIDYPLEHLLEENDISPELVINWLLEEQLIDLTLYRIEEEEE